MKKFTDLDPFTQAYLTAAFWTSEETLRETIGGTVTSGCDFCDTGVTAEFFALLDESTLAKIEDSCAVFQVINADMLTGAGDAEQNGHDFWLTRNHHGAGFWDRGYAESVSKNLTDTAHAAGEVDIYTGDDGKIYQSP